MYQCRIRTRENIQRIPCLNIATSNRDSANLTIYPKLGNCTKVSSFRINHPSFFLGVPTVVRTNILIRSMGPVSELDMVRLEIFSDGINRG